MSADSKTTPSAVRLETLERASKWTIAVGLALVALGIGGALLSGRWTSLRAFFADESVGLLGARILVGVGLLVFLIGLIAYVFIPTRSRERAIATYARLPMVVATLAIAALPANLIGIAYALLGGQSGATGAPSPEALLASIVPLEASLLIVLYLRIVRPGALTWQEMGLTAARLGARIGQGVGAYVALLIAAGVINYLLQSAGVRQTQVQTFQGITAASTLELLALLVAAGILAPIAEEAFFRGYVFTAYLRTRGRPIAYLLSAGLFAVVHFNAPALPAIFAVGLILAFVFDLTKSLIPSIIAHGLNNSVAFLVLFLSPGIAPPG